MSSRILRGLAGCAVAILPLLATPALAQVAIAEARSGSSGIAFSTLDPDQTIRKAVDRDVSRRIVQRVRRDTTRGEGWTETMFSALAAVSSEINRLDREGRLDGPSRREIGALAAIAVVDVVIDEHPELTPVLAGFSEDEDQYPPSPIERLCACDRSGSEACGCQVTSSGAGECEYRVLCHGWIRAGCSAVNIELCIAETVVDIISPLA